MKKGYNRQREGQVMWLTFLRMSEFLITNTVAKKKEINGNRASKKWDFRYIMENKKLKVI